MRFRSKLDLTVIVVKSTKSMAIWFVRISMHGASNKHRLSLVIVPLILNVPKNCISFFGLKHDRFFRGTGGVPPTGISVINPLTHLMFGGLYSF